MKKGNAEKRIAGAIVAGAAVPAWSEADAPAHGPAAFGSGCHLASACAPGFSLRSARTDLTDRLREGGATEVAQAGATAVVGGVGSGPLAEAAMPSPGAAASAGAAISGACSTSCRGPGSPNR